MTFNTILEVLSTALGLGFLVGIIGRHTWAWPLGIVSSAISVALFARIGLYAESGLYVVYVLMGFYGWKSWASSDHPDQVDLVDVPWVRQWPWILAGIPAALLLALGLNLLPGVSFAYFDAFTTVFALLATYQEAKRFRTAFHYWIPINFATVLLYSLKGLWIYAGLMVIYTVMSVVGYLNWRR